MSWDHEAWGRFLATVEQIALGQRHDWRNSFVLYAYEPALEAKALVQVQNAMPALCRQPLAAQVISWGAYMAEFLQTQGFLRRGVATPDESQRLRENLSERLPDQLAQHTERVLAGKQRTHIAFVVRTGAIFPFTTISQTLAACEKREIRATLAVLGPGHTSDQGNSFGLLTGAMHPGYPALVVGPGLGS